MAIVDFDFASLYPNAGNGGDAWVYRQKIKKRKQAIADFLADDEDTQTREGSTDENEIHEQQDM
jgi:hypothetical protein